MTVSLRKATLADIPAIEPLIAASVRELQAGFYTPDEREAALGSVFGVDTKLIEDGTYFVAECEGEVAACGGWSRRKTMFGSNDSPVKDDAWLDPAVDAARIRAFFVGPKWARRGIGSAIMRACEAAAKAEGFQRLELVATLPGERLYLAHGFEELERFEAPLPGGGGLPVIRMSKQL